ncbi:MAG: hypothetical protein WBL67_19775 [Nitrososphaeraceae archaeon]
MVITGPTDVLRISPLDQRKPRIFAGSQKSIADESHTYKDVKGKG